MKRKIIMKRLVIETKEQELKVLEHLGLLGLLGFEWIDGDEPKEFIPSIDAGTWKSFPFSIFIDIDDATLTWES